MVNLLNDIINGGNSVANIRRVECFIDKTFIPRCLLGIIRRYPCPSPESIDVMIEILHEHYTLKSQTIDSYAMCKLFQLMDRPLTNTLLRYCLSLKSSLVDVLPVIPMDDSVHEIVEKLLDGVPLNRDDIHNVIRGNHFISPDEFMEIYDRAHAKKVLLGDYLE